MRSPSAAVPDNLVAASVKLTNGGSSGSGVIVGYDADCHCERNYLTAIARHFQQHPRTPGCSIYFEHPLEGPLEPQVYEAAAAYELHLRYYAQALRWAGFPYAHHTIGSSMAVRAGVYRKQGGMNKRQAGEDFYFLHKVIPLGGYTDLTDTAVYPAPRASDRVPFGTGKAVRSCLSGTTLTTYPLEAFADLKILFEQLPAIYRDGNFTCATSGEKLPESMRTFLQTQNFDKALAELRAHTASETAFRKRFFHWFNGFQAMKFIHLARDHFYGERGVELEAQRLWERLSGVIAPLEKLSMRGWLQIFRDLDRH